MTDAPIASAEELARRRLLADRVHAELRRAGLPTHDAFEGDDRAGAAVGVDPGNDSLGGVFIDWRPDPELTAAVVAAAWDGDPEFTAARRSNEIGDAMSTAITAILRTAGLHAEAGANDLDPQTVYVVQPTATGTV
ncbi:hypothetical protein [Nocardia sp. NPDC004722]